MMGTMPSPVMTVAQTIAERRAAAEAKAAEERNARLAKVNAWEPPPIGPGDDVLWYQDADPSKTPEPARVKRVRGRTVDLVFFGNGWIKDGVRFIGDPSLEENENHKENGAWEFLPTDLQDREELKVIRNMLESIHQELTNTTKLTGLNHNRMMTLENRIDKMEAKRGKE